MPAIKKVRDAVLGNDKLDLLLAGHGHLDHSWDTPTWSRLTGAPMIGGHSACLQATRRASPATRCRTVSGGEKIDLGDGITIRVVRCNHSGDPHQPDPALRARALSAAGARCGDGGLRAGVGEDYPNGGGNRAFLFTVDRPRASSRSSSTTPRARSISTRTSSSTA